MNGYGPDMDREGTTKRQHYVPRFVLKNFSANRKTFATLHLESGKVYPKTPLKSQCYESYFYGKDQVMEDSFARSEDEISSLLGDLSDQHLNSISPDRMDKLRMFVHYQAGRTKAAAQRQTEYISAFVRQMASTKAELEGAELSLDEMDLVKLVNPNEVNDAVWQAMKSTPITSDLDVRFLRARAPNAFVISDHPVVLYNQFAESHPQFSRCPSLGGLASMGAQLFMPLSSDVVLLASDPNVYEFDVKKNVGNVGKRDVMHINSMQAVNALECVFFESEKVNEKTIARMLKARSSHPGMHSCKAEEIERRPKDGGGFNQVVVGTRSSVRINARLSCLRVNAPSDFAEYDSAHVPVRSPELMAFSRHYSNMLEKAVEKNKSFDVLVRDLEQDPAIAK